MAMERIDGRTDGRKESKRRQLVFGSVSAVLLVMVLLQLDLDVELKKICKLMATSLLSSLTTNSAINCILWN